MGERIDNPVRGNGDEAFENLISRIEHPGSSIQDPAPLIPVRIGFLDRLCCLFGWHRIDAVAGAPLESCWSRDPWCELEMPVVVVFDGGPEIRSAGPGVGVGCGVEDQIVRGVVEEDADALQKIAEDHREAAQFLVAGEREIVLVFPWENPRLIR